MITYFISISDHSRRFESFVSSQLPTANISYIRKLIRSGAVKLNAAIATSDTFLGCGDAITLKESGTTLSLLGSSPPAVDILYEDLHIAVINKPAGVAMHKTAEYEDNLVLRGMEYMAWRGTACKLYPVNRLDRGTSGAVILAKSSASAGMYGRQVKEVGLDKLYLALVYGTPNDAGTISCPLDGKESETHYKILLHGREYTLLAVKPVSGRMHQIRRHLQSIGHPVVGDKRYGGVLLAGYDGFALHSYRTVIPLKEDENLPVCAPLSEGLCELCFEDGIKEALLAEKLQQLW